MHLVTRFKKLTLWNKIGVVGALASILGGVIAAATLFCHHPNTDKTTTVSDNDSVCQQVQITPGEGNIVISGAVNGDVSVERSDRKNAPGRLSIKLHRSEYTNFVVPTTHDGWLADYSPPQTYLLTDEGLLIEYHSSKNGEPLPWRPTEQFPSHLPDGEMIIDLIVAATNDTVNVNSVRMVLDKVDNIPPLESTGVVKPILDPVADSVIIKREIEEYRLFKRQVLRYKPDEADHLRITTVIADDEPPGVYQLHLVIDYQSEDGVHSESTTPFIICKRESGPTKRIPVEKRHGQIRNNKHKSLSDMAKLIFQEKSSFSDFQTTGRYHAELEIYTDVADLVDDARNTESFIKGYQSTVDLKTQTSDELIKQANKLQGLWLVKHTGYLERESFEDLNRQLKPLFGDKWIRQEWRTDGKYVMYFVVNAYGSMVIYGWNTHPQYRRLMAQAKKLAETLEKTDATKLAAFLAQQIEHPNVSVGGILDTVPLLAYFRNDAAYRCLTKLLTHKNLLVRRRVVDVFASIRYTDAARNLIHILKNREFDKTNSDVLLSSPNNSHLQIYLALAVNGNNEVYKQMLKLIKTGHIPKMEWRWAAYVLLWSDPDTAFQYAKKLVAHKGQQLDEQIGFFILRDVKNASSPLENYGMFNPQLKRLSIELSKRLRADGRELRETPKFIGYCPRAKPL